MHFSTTALYVILLSILEGSKTAHAFPYEDAFGMIYYGYKCFDRLYPAHIIYATAKHYCDLTKYQPFLSELTHKDPEYRNKHVFGKLFVDEKFVEPESYDIIPILPDGTMYPFELKPERRLTKNSAGETVKIDPGYDRLIVDKDCDIITVLTELANKRNTKTGRNQQCKVIELWKIV